MKCYFLSLWLQFGGMGRRMILPFFFFQLEVSQSGEFLEGIQTSLVSFRQANSFRRGLLKERLSLG